MPQKKIPSELPKNISCPRCGKRFSTATNVLQHMNQPFGLCYRASVAEEMGLTTTENSAENSVDRERFHSLEDVEVPDVAHWEDGDEDIRMDVSPNYNDPSTPFDDPHESQREQLPGPGGFVEAYEGCTEAFPGGETFMGQFRCDQYAEQRRENNYFPWASRQEWGFASWLLRSRLSMAAIDSLLSLEIVSHDILASSKTYHLQQIRNIPLSFRSAKELRTCAKTLPSGPQWVCETLTTEYPTKEPAYVFYHNPIECLQALLSHPLFEPHISFVPRKVWTSAAKICRVYNEWLSGDHAWSMQVHEF